MPPRRVSPRDRTLEKAVRMYVEALEDPSAPKYCGIALTGLLLKILPESDVYADVLASHHDFWDASITFLTIGRTEEDLETLLNHLSRCDCAMTPYLLDLHSTCNRGERDFRERKGGIWTSHDGYHALSRARFPHLLFATLSRAVHLVKPKVVAKGAKATWPQAITDLIPFGAETTVGTLVRWHHALYNDLIIFCLLQAMAHLCRSLIMPHIANSALPALMISSGRALFDRTDKGLASPDLHRRRQCANSFFFQADPINSFLLCVLRESIGEVQFARGNETKLVQLCNLLVHLSTDPRLPPERAVGDTRIQLYGCIVWASHLYRMFYMYLPPRPPIVLHPDVAKYDQMTFPPAETTHDLRGTVHTALSATRRHMNCASWGCTQTLQSLGKAFMRCARCHVVCYCGKECQSRAWKEGKYPHRLLCPVFSQLMRIGGDAATHFGPTTQAMALERWAAGNIPEADFQLVHDWWINLQELAQVDPSLTVLMPNGTEWRPGFDDYDEVVARFGADGNGPKSFLVNPLARLPSEVAKVKAAHEALPFHGEEFM